MFGVESKHVLAAGVLAFHRLFHELEGLNEVNVTGWDIYARG